MSDKSDLQIIEEAIYGEYQRFHKQNPSLRPQEVGRLGQLWAHFDYLIALGG